MSSQEQESEAYRQGVEARMQMQVRPLVTGDEVTPEMLAEMGREAAARKAGARRRSLVEAVKGRLRNQKSS